MYFTQVGAPVGSGTGTDPHSTVLLDPGIPILLQGLTQAQWDHLVMGQGRGQVREQASLFRREARGQMELLPADWCTEVHRELCALEVVPSACSALGPTGGRASCWHSGWWQITAAPHLVFRDLIYNSL